MQPSFLEVDSFEEGTDPNRKSWPSASSLVGRGRSQSSGLGVCSVEETGRNRNPDVLGLAYALQSGTSFAFSVEGTGPRQSRACWRYLLGLWCSWFWVMKEAHSALSPGSHGELSCAVLCPNSHESFQTGTCRGSWDGPS